MVFFRLVVTRELRPNKRLASLALSFLAGCGTPAEVDSSMPAIISSSAFDQNGGSSDAQGVQGLMTPPAEYYENLFGEVVENTDRGSYQLADLEAPAVLWLSFGAIDVPKGSSRGQSFLVCGDTAKIPAAKLATADQTAIISAVQAAFDRTSLAVNVTTTRPSSGAFSTLALGGTYADLGCKDPAVLGIAPFDSGNANARDVGFVFSAAILASGSQVARVQAEAILQAGRIFGLTDLASESGASKPQARRSTPTVAGFDQLPAELANLPGLSQLAGIAKALPELTADMIVDISSLTPRIEELFPATVANVNLPSLERSLTVVHLATDAAGGDHGGSPGVTIGGSTSTSPTVVTNSKTPTTNPGNIGSVLSSLSTALNGAKSILSILGLGKSPMTNQPASPATQPMLVATSMTSLPDLMGMLGLLEGDVDLGVLIHNFVGTVQLVSGNYTGNERDALLSLVKTSYAQAYQKLIRKAK